MLVYFKLQNVAKQNSNTSTKKMYVYKVLFIFKVIFLMMIVVFSKFKQETSRLFFIHCINSSVGTGIITAWYFWENHQIHVVINNMKQNIFFSFFLQLNVVRIVQIVSSRSCTFNDIAVQNLLRSTATDTMTDIGVYPRFNNFKSAG